MERAKRHPPIPSSSAENASEAAAHLSRGELALRFEEVGGELGFVVARGRHEVASCRRPLGIGLIDSSGDRGRGRSGYSRLAARGDRARAAGAVELQGARFEIEDRFLLGDEGIEIRRRVRVVGSLEGVGFFSFLELFLPAGGRVGAGVEDPWFIPGLWYGRNLQVPPLAIGSPESRLKGSALLFREDRLALPLVLHYDEHDRRFISLSHLGATPTTVAADDDDAALVDPRLGFGSFGLADGGATLTFCFPGSEGAVLYAPMWTIPRGNRQADSPVNPFAAKRASARAEGWIWRAHPVSDRFTHAYTLEIGAGPAASLLDASSAAWRRLWSAYRPRVRRAPLRRIEGVSVALLDRLVIDAGEASGLPTWIDCFTGEPGKLQDTFSIGFVSRNLEVALVLLKAGWRRGSPAMRAKGERILDFWTTNGGMGLSHTEYDYRLGAWADARSEAGLPAVYLRDQSEAHRVCLACCASEHARGLKRAGWLAWARSYGDWLLEHQNGDGSFHRSYELSGRPASSATADSSHVVAFLCDLAAATGAGAYLACAQATAEYLWSTYHRQGLYFGGTLDNPNSIDKEASALALDGYLRLFESTSDGRWLEAADRSARICESWIIAWEIPMPAEPGVPRFYPSGRTTVGLQLITTGFSAVDMFLGRQAGDFMRLARYSGDRHWMQVARILLHNTKGLVQLHGELGYRYDGFQIEHWAIGRGRGYGLNSGWLPWVASSHVIGIWARSFRRSHAAIPKKLA